MDLIPGQLISSYTPPIRVTLEFATFAEASAALAKLAGTITPEDRPDVGQMVLPLAQPSAAQVFGGAAVPMVPPAAPSTAAAGAFLTAHGVVPAGAPMQQTASQPPALPPAQPGVVPSAPAAPTNPAGVEVDADGLPWDNRIHASSKDGPGKNADGRWRQKRGLNDPALKKRVEDELRAAMAAGRAPAAPSPTVVPPPAGVVAPPAAPPAAPVATAETFATLMIKITQAQAAKKLTEAKVAEALSYVQLTAPGQLVARPDLVPTVGAVIDQMIATAA